MEKSNFPIIITLAIARKKRPKRMFLLNFNGWVNNDYKDQLCS